MVEYVCEDCGVVVNRDPVIETGFFIMYCKKCSKVRKFSAR